MTTSISLMEEGNNEAKVFQLFFMRNDNYQSVKVVETQKIDVEELIECLNRGESVFIKKII